MIHITKNGFKRLEWNGDLREYMEKEFESALCLRDGVTEVEEGVTLGEIIAFTYRDEFLRGFIGCYSSCDVSAFYEELQWGVKPLAVPSSPPPEPATSAPEPSGLSPAPRFIQEVPNSQGYGELRYCTVAMEVEVSESKKYKISKTLDISLDFHGRGEDARKWSLDLAPLAEIAALPFRLEANACVQHLLEGSYEVEDGLRYTPSLLEVLDAIFFDISFHGSPAEKAGVSLDLERRVKEIRDGTAKLVPLKLEEDETIQ
jgi:hypothetical protein